MFQNYSPPRATETIVEYDALIGVTSAANLAVTVDINSYNSAVKLRSGAFRSNTISVVKLLAPIAASVKAMYGKDSREATSIMTMTNKMRATKPVEATNPDGTIRTISQSEQSYGSLTLAFKSIIATLSNFNGYNPSRAELKIAALTAFSNSLDTLNQNVNLTFNKLTDSRTVRNDNYAELKSRTERIKAYTLSEYGNNSSEHKQIKGLKV